MIKGIQYFLSFALLLAVFACQDKKYDPTLSVLSNPHITSPVASESFVFLEAQEDDAFEVTWSAEELNLTDLGNTEYTLAFGAVGSTFDEKTALITTEDLSYSTSIKAMNQKIIALGFPKDEPANLEFVVSAFITDSDFEIFSDATPLTITPYEAAPIDAKPVYLIGSGTPVGWDNTIALPFTHIEDGIFEIVTVLYPGVDQAWKVLSLQGQWAPQWGSDETGDAFSGGLSYRPTESDPDPAFILVPDFQSQFKITVDTANLTYTVAEFGDIYMLGDGSPRGWDNTNALPLIKTAEGVYSVTTDLPGGGYLKFIDDLGAWAPQWGTDDTGTSESGPLVLRPTEDEPDPAAIPAPADAGTYTIEIDIVNLTYSISQ